MSRQEELNRLINNIASDLEGFMGASVVDVETGMSLASVSRINNFDLDVGQPGGHASHPGKSAPPCTPP